MAGVMMAGVVATGLMAISVGVTCGVATVGVIAGRVGWIATKPAKRRP